MASSASGFTVQRAKPETTQITEKPKIQGLRGPFWSAMAPRIGLTTAMARPDRLSVQPHQAVPVSSSGAMPVVK